MSYKAFISYSHATDGQLAPAIQSALHKFAKPFYRLRAVRVFRDETSLHLTPELWPRIHQALSESEYFILMASPPAAESRWVQNEVEAWLELKGGSLDKFLVILTEGEIKWDNSRNDFDWDETTALPPGLKAKFKVEPLHLDFRWAKETTQLLSLRNPQFLRGIGKLAAAIRNEPLDTMIGEDVRQHRIFKFVASAIATLLVALSIGASSAAYYANERKKEAVEERKGAEDARNKAEDAAKKEQVARKEAEEQSLEAKRQQGLAEESSIRAEKARIIADEQRRRAETQTRLATNMKTVGELYREASNIEAKGFPDSYFEEYQGGDIPGLFEKILSKYRETNDLTGQISTLIFLGDKSGDNNSQAIRDYEEALSISKAKRDSASQVASLLRLALAYEKAGNHSAAQRYQNEAPQIYAKEPAKAAQVLLDIGWMYGKTKDDAKVTKYFAEAADAFLKIGDSYGAGRAYSDLGNYYFRQFNSALGASYYLKSIPLLEGALTSLREAKDRERLALTYESIATMCSITQDKEKARRYYLMALPVFEELKNNNKAQRTRDQIKQLGSN